MSHRPTATLKNSRVIALGLSLGVLGFWAVAWFTTLGGTEPLGMEGPVAAFALWIWVAVALPALGGALFFKERAAGSSNPRRFAEPHGPPIDPAQVQTNLIIAQALAEGPALLGGVLFLLTGLSSLAWVVLPVYAVGAFVTWPRAEWFGLR